MLAASHLRVYIWRPSITPSPQHHNNNHESTTNRRGTTLACSVIFPLATYQFLRPPSSRPASSRPPSARPTSARSAFSKHASPKPAFLRPALPPSSHHTSTNNTHPRRDLPLRTSHAVASCCFYEQYPSSTRPSFSHQSRCSLALLLRTTPILDATFLLALIKL